MMRRSRWRLAAGVVAAMFVVVSSGAPSAQAAGAGDLVVTGGTLIDGTVGAPRMDATFLVRNGRIVEVAEGRIEGLETDLDPYVIPGISLHRELQLLVEAGLSPREVLAAATRTAAAFLGQPGALGTLEPGKLADFLMLGADTCGVHLRPAADRARGPGRAGRLAAVDP